MTSDKRLAIGGNNPPDEDRLLIEKITSDHSDILMLYEQGVARVDEMPTEINDDVADIKVSDYIKKLKGYRKMLDAARDAEKAPHMQKANVIQQFFKSRMEKIDGIMAKLDEPLSRYKQKKKDDEQRARNEAARKEAEERDRLLKEAQARADEERRAREAAEADAKALREKADRERQEREAEAEKKRKEAEAEAERKKKEAEAEAGRLRKEAEEEKRKSDAIIAQLEADKKKLEDQAEEDRKKREREIEAEKRRIERETEEKQKALEKEAKAVQRTAEKEADATLRDGNREARELEREGRQAEREAEQEIKEIASEVKELRKESDDALDAAIRQDRVATKAERATQEKGSVLSRTRGELSMSSVTEYVVASVADRDELLHSAATIWDHIPFSALEQAVQSWANANKENRALRGAIITIEQKTMVR